MRELILILSLVAIGWICFNFTKKKPVNEGDKEQFFTADKNETIEISLKELSAIWTCYNEKQPKPEAGLTTEPVVPNEDDSSVPTESDNDTPSIEEDDTDSDYYLDILNAIGEKVNVANDKGIYEIFSIGMTVYVHTSGLNRIIKQLTQEIDKEVIKAKIKSINDRFIKTGIAPYGFQKYRWESFEGDRGKSLYMAISVEFLPDGTTTEDTSNIQLMEKEND